MDLLFVLWYSKGKGVVSFYRIWMGRKEGKSEDLILQGFSNIGLGLIVTVIMLVLLTLLGL